MSLAEVNAMKIEKGKRFFWEDPEGLLSQWVTVDHFNGEVAICDTDSGGCVEAYPVELKTKETR